MWSAISSFSAAVDVWRESSLQISLLPSPFFPLHRRTAHTRAHTHTHTHTHLYLYSQSFLLFFPSDSPLSLSLFRTSLLRNNCFLLHSRPLLFKRTEGRHAAHSRGPFSVALPSRTLFGGVCDSSQCRCVGDCELGRAHRPRAVCLQRGGSCERVLSYYYYTHARTHTHTHTYKKAQTAVMRGKVGECAKRARIRKTRERAASPPSAMRPTLVSLC